MGQVVQLVRRREWTLAMEVSIEPRLRRAHAQIQIQSQSRWMWIESQIQSRQSDSYNGKNTEIDGSTGR